MTFETETFLTLEEYKKLSLRLTFKRKFVKLVIFAGPLSLIMLCLQWFGVITALDESLQALFLVFLMFGISIPVSAVNAPAKHYASNKMFHQSRLFVFDDEKVYYKLKGAEGFIAWEYVNRIEQVDGFLLIYTSDLYAFIVKADKLNLEQINFIKSHVSINTK